MDGRSSVRGRRMDMEERKRRSRSPWVARVGPQTPFIQYQKGLNNEALNKLINRVKDLKHKVSLDKSLGNGFCIGHSYFCGRDNGCTLSLTTIFFQHSARIGSTMPTSSSVGRTFRKVCFDDQG